MRSFLRLHAWMAERVRVMTMSTISVTALVSHTQGRMDRGAAEPCFARRAATVVGNRVREAVFSTVKRTMLSEAMLPQPDSFSAQPLPSDRREWLRFPAPEGWRQNSL